MKRMQAKVLLLQAAMMLAAAPLGWSQQKTPVDKPPAPQATEADQNSITVGVVGELFSEDQNNLSGYWPVLEKRTKETWLGLMPPPAQPPESTPGTVSILCVVHTDGSVTGMALEQKSGTPALDRAAWAAIRQSAPYDAFPSGISTDKVRVRFTFSYNGGATVGPLVKGVKPRM